MNRSYSELVKKLAESLDQNQAETILVSGGLDSGILSSLCPNTKGITVSLEGKGEDLRYVSILQQATGLDVLVVKIGVEEALSNIKEVVKILGSFDPAIPNDMAVYFGMKEARKLGFKSIMTGDGADELFGGYSYMQEIADLDAYIRRVSQNMAFGSNRIGEHFGLDVEQPYLDKEFVEFALGLGSEYKIKMDNGKKWGKWILRKAFEPFLPSEFLWQEKRPLEVGSGMAHLREIICERITDEEFEEKKLAYPVSFLCKEHVFFYEIFCQEIGEPPRSVRGEDCCTSCGGGKPAGRKHCRICGWIE